MNRQEIETEIAQIRADREGKRGRWPAGVKERLAELEAMLVPNAALKGDDMTDETTNTGADEREAGLDAREAALNEREAALDAREAAVAELEGALVPEEAPAAFEEDPDGNGRVTVANLTVPLSGGKKNVLKGAVVKVPDDFLAAMIEAGRMEKV